jgi:hypothetical protein
MRVHSKQAVKSKALGSGIGNTVLKFRDLIILTEE